MSATVLPAAGPQPLRRRPPQAAAGPHRATVRRNLFGPVDHEENLRFVHAELAKMAEADARRWNFDFARERPLAGRFAWERPARAWRTPAPKRQTAITGRHDAAAASLFAGPLSGFGGREGGTCSVAFSLALGGF